MMSLSKVQARCRIGPALPNSFGGSPASRRWHKLQIHQMDLYPSRALRRAGFEAHSAAKRSHAPGASDGTMGPSFCSTLRNDLWTFATT
jgi:hypothetical protein